MQALVVQRWRWARPSSARYWVSPVVSRVSALAIRADSRRSRAP